MHVFDWPDLFCDFFDREHQTCSCQALEAASFKGNWRVMIEKCSLLMFLTMTAFLRGHIFYGRNCTLFNRQVLP